MEAVALQARRAVRGILHHRVSKLFTHLIQKGGWEQQIQHHKSRESILSLLISPSVFYFPEIKHLQLADGHKLHFLFVGTFALNSLDCRTITQKK